MNKEKQIEEMAKIIARRSTAFRNSNVAFMTTATKTAESLYTAGYRKQSEGEWEPHKDFNPFLRTDVIGGYICSCCENESDEITKFCPECGAHMKGGAE
jgi:rubrerythrin